MGADPNMAGNIIAGFNIGDKTTGVTAYFIGNGIAALEYLALHEVAHESEAGMNMYLGTPDKLYNDFTPGSTNYADENFANTVALATMEALALSLDHYDPSLTTGKQTVRGDWQTDVIWTVNNQ